MSSNAETTLVVTDLDGTLWGNDLVCHPATLDACAQLERSGVSMLVATGRRAGSALPALQGNGLTLPSVLLNGALGVDFRTGDRFHEHGFSALETEAVLNTFAEHDLWPCVYLADGRVAVPPNASTNVAHVQGLGADSVLDDLSGLGDRHRVLCFSILGISHDRIASAISALQDRSSCEVAWYDDHLYGETSCMVQPPGISKWVGIQAWIAHSGLAPDRIIAMGDGGNDLEMLAAADIAISFEGADERAQHLADVVAPHPDAGGWATILDLI